MTQIDVNDIHVLAGLSPYNWVIGPDFVSSAGGGSTLTVGFANTDRVELLVDTSVVTTPVAGRFPVIAWTVNGGELQSRQLRAGQKSITLSEEVPDPLIDLYTRGFCPFEERFSGLVPPNSVKLTGFVVADGGRTRPVRQPDKIWLNIGDSILSGDAALYAAEQGRPHDDHWAASNDSRASYGHLLAQHFGYRESRLAYGGYNWRGGIGAIPALPVLLDWISEEASRLDGALLTPAPHVVLVNLGENGAPEVDLVVQSLHHIRLRTGGDTTIIVMIPVSGRGRAEVTSAFAQYVAGTDDARIHLVDAGDLVLETADGQHPTAAGNRTIFQAALPHFEKILA